MITPHGSWLRRLLAACCAGFGSAVALAQPIWLRELGANHRAGGGCPFCAQMLSELDNEELAAPDAALRPVASPEVKPVVVPGEQTAPAGPTAPPGGEAPPPAGPAAVPVTQAQATPLPPLAGARTTRSKARAGAGTSSARPPPAPKRALPVAATRPAPLKSRQSVDGYLPVSFEDLASFAIADPPLTQQPTPGAMTLVPPDLRELDGRTVSLDGFMLPTRLEKGLVKEFLFLRNQSMCCYGVSPALNEWVIVKMKGGGVEAHQDVPTKLYGKLHVGEIYEGGMLFGIYEIEGDKLAVD
ncbi:MAG TPA: DUF3299 domain-containing protein [Lacunisphaera sp.]|nr:DUF3299 domain-containing protein [Lacunisphaera sp.]